jgi:hypothetical protein
LRQVNAQRWYLLLILDVGGCIWLAMSPFESNLGANWELRVRVYIDFLHTSDPTPLHTIRKGLRLRTILAAFAETSQGRDNLLLLFGMRLSFWNVMGDDSLSQIFTSFPTFHFTGLEVRWTIGWVKLLEWFALSRKMIRSRQFLWFLFIYLPWSLNMNHSNQSCKNNRSDMECLPQDLEVKSHLFQLLLLDTKVSSIKRSA